MRSKVVTFNPYDAQSRLANLNGLETITVYQTSFLSNDLDNKSQRSKGYKFYGVYPMEISPMQYDSSGPGNVLTFTVTFQYTFYSVL